MTDADHPSALIAGVIGSPIGHSRSPAIMSAALAAAGLDWHFAALEVGKGHGIEAVEAMRTLGLRGLSVTMPLKTEVIRGLDRVTPEAHALGAVNCIAWDGTELVGHNTDGSGFVDSLARNDVDPMVGRAVVLGAGGAARAIIDALARAGSPEVVVINRTSDRAVAAAALADDVGRVGTIDDIAAAHLVINATSVGMDGTPNAGKLPLPAGLLRSDHVVADIVYVPLRTPLLAAADALGATTIDGLGMLAAQAARAFTLWTGMEAPIDVMEAAARQTL